MRHHVSQIIVHLLKQNSARCSGVGQASYSRVSRCRQCSGVCANPVLGPASFKTFVLAAAVSSNSRLWHLICSVLHHRRSLCIERLAVVVRCDEMPMAHDPTRIRLLNPAAGN